MNLGGMSKEDLQEILTAVSNSNSATLAGAIKEALLASKALPLDEQLALDDKKARAENSKKEWRAMIVYENEQKKRLVEGCGHRKENGRWSISGQIVGGKDVRLICLRCQGVWDVKINPETKSLIEHGDIELLGSAPPAGVLARPA